MSLSYGDVRRWNAGPLDSMFAELKTSKDRLIALQDELDSSAHPEGWTGKAADAANKAHHKLVDRLERTVAGLAAAQRAVEDASVAVTGLGLAIMEADELARGYYFRITDGGKVVDDNPLPDTPRDRGAVKSEITARVRQILRRARDIDKDLAAVLSDAREGDIDDEDAFSLTSAAMAGDLQGALSLIGPPKNATPAMSAGWWDTLGYNEKIQVLADHPEWIGNRDGIPADWRHRANLRRLHIERAKLEDRRDELTADLDDNMFGGLFTNDDARLEHVQAKLDGLDALSRELFDDKTGQPRADRQLLLLDTSHADLRVAVSVGQVNNAHDVGVLVPGVGTDALDIDNQLNHAETLHTQADALNGEHKTAVIAWIGYDPPNESWQAPVPGGAPPPAGGGGAPLPSPPPPTAPAPPVLGGDAAEDGGEALTDYLRGIDTSANENPHLTVVGHSLGSTTGGYAVQATTGVDDFVAAGSPGLGTTNYGDLRVPDGHVHVLETSDDRLVADSHWFGRDPSWFEEANQLRTNDSTVGHGISGHSEYFDEDSTSAFNMAAVIAGKYDQTLKV